MSKIYKHYSEIIMSKIHKHYSEEAKLSLIRSYYQSGQSKKRFCISHDIWCIGLLNSWLKKYEISQEMVSLCSEPASVEDMANRSKDSYKEEGYSAKEAHQGFGESSSNYSKTGNFSPWYTDWCCYWLLMRLPFLFNNKSAHFFGGLL